MRAHHAKIQGVNLCILHGERFGGDCPECVGEDEAKRAATYCETHDEMFEAMCPRCAMWKANILDQDVQETLTAKASDAPQAADGWVDWYGGECPVNQGLEIEILRRDGEVLSAPAGWFVWGHDLNPFDIVRYRLVQNAPSEPQTAPGATQNTDGWVDWNGGECPVGDGVFVSLRMRDGEIHETVRDPNDWSWTNTRSWDDIVAYKVLNVPQTTPSEPQSGGVKFDQGKPPVSLVDRHAIEQIANVLAFGAKKYAAHNWRQGINYSRLLDAALRHLFAFADGEDNDPESGLSHIAHAGCCVVFLLGMINTRPDLDDRFKATK